MTHSHPHSRYPKKWVSSSSDSTMIIIASFVKVGAPYLVPTIEIESESIHLYDILGAPGEWHGGVAKPSLALCARTGIVGPLLTNGMEAVICQRS